MMVCLLPPAKSREDGCTRSRWQGIIGESRAKKPGERQARKARTKEIDLWMAHSLVHSQPPTALAACMGSLAQSFHQPSQRDLGNPQ
jgi:hypothetical protein